MNSICLVIVYNHNYEKNIAVLNRIYAGRFSNVYHIMPFYRGNDPHVIGVYESAYQFSGYLTQASGRFMDREYAHYVFVADDLMLAPDINENNICDRLKLAGESGFVSVVRPIDWDELLRWPFALASYMNLLASGNACEGQRFLPDEKTVCDCLLRHGIGVDWRVSVSQIRTLALLAQPLRETPYAYRWLPLGSGLAKMTRLLRRGQKAYPLVHGFSDLTVVPGAVIKDFLHYCGVFAACRVFVEAAIPMSLLFCCKRVNTLKDLNLEGQSGNDGEKDRDGFAGRFQFDYQQLAERFPKTHLYVHPVKLSKWRNLP